MASRIKEAINIIKNNDRGGYTVPTNRLYPYQWNWDSGFTALGTGYRNNSGNLVDVRRRYSFWTQDTLSVIDSIETYYWTLKLSFDSNNALLVPDSSGLGHPVRLIKDH